jgi:hypothetical protein
MENGHIFRSACTYCDGDSLVSLRLLELSRSHLLNPIYSIVAYAFVKSFPQGPDNTQPASPLVRIAIISLGPIVWNAAVLLVLFLVSLFLGPMLDTCCAKFGAIMASIAHFMAVVGMVGFFEFLVRHSLHSSSVVLTLLFVVVPGALGCVARGLGCDRSHLYTACGPQNPHLRVPFSRVQTR